MLKLWKCNCFFVESGPLITYLVTGFDVVDIVEMDQVDLVSCWAHLVFSFLCGLQIDNRK